MKLKINQKIIILFLVLFLLTSFSWLAFIEKKQEQVKNQWFLYFKNPTKTTLDFVIENHTDSSKFEWQILINDKILKQKSITVLKNKNINVSIDIPSDISSNKKIIKIKVFHQKTSKEIYKKF